MCMYVCIYSTFTAPGGAFAAIGQFGGRNAIWLRYRNGGGLGLALAPYLPTGIFYKYIYIA